MKGCEIQLRKMKGRRFNLFPRGDTGGWTAADKMISDDLRERIIKAAGEDAGVIALRWSGLNNRQIAELYEVSRSRIYQRVERVRLAVMEQVPEVADELRHRGRKGHKRRRCAGCGEYLPWPVEGWGYCGTCRMRHNTTA